MPLLLPNLDDRSWTDLVDEGRSLIPVYAPEWTDHNVHDPGITLMELLAWITEMDIYRLNQISDDEKRKFLALLGVFLAPPHPAEAVLSFTLKNGIPPVTLPRGLEFSGLDSLGRPTRFRTLNTSTVVPGSLEALQSRDKLGFQNLTPAWRRRAVIYPFGKSPQPGVTFYLGFSRALPPGVWTNLFFTFADGYSGREQQRRYRDEDANMKRDCSPFPNPCRDGLTQQSADESHCGIQHHGVRTVWEFPTLINGKVEWVRLHSPTEVDDKTRALTFDGSLRVKIPAPMRALALGGVPAPLYYLRCRFEAGRYDAAPLLQDVAFNGVRAEQAVPVSTSFVIDESANIIYLPSGPPKPNDFTTLRLQFNSTQKITVLEFGNGNDGDPQFRVLEYREPALRKPGLLNIEGVLLGFGNDFPNQQFRLPDAPVQQSSFHLYTLEDDVWHKWKLQRDFDASTRTSFDYLLDPTGGLVTLGNGEEGRVAPEILTKTGVQKCLVFAAYRATRAEAGNLNADTINQLADSGHNRALLYDPAASPNGFERLKTQLRSVTNTISASGGAPAETIAHAISRAVRLVDSSDRAVTLEDYERLALQTPGTRIARATARANLHPSFPCFDAPGLITVIVLPHLPEGRPVPSQGLLRKVAAYLRRRRVVGTRVEVVGPKYLEVTIRASVQSIRGTNKLTLQQEITKALNDFLNGTRWPFGRDVYRAEIMRVIDEVRGVDHLLSLELIAAGCEPQCGNVCLGPTWLVASGPHEISVL